MHPIELDANLKLAKNQLRSGKVAEAEGMYQKILKANLLCAVFRSATEDGGKPW